MNDGKDDCVLLRLCVKTHSSDGARRRQNVTREQRRILIISSVKLRVSRVYTEHNQVSSTYALQAYSAGKQNLATLWDEMVPAARHTAGQLGHQRGRVARRRRIQCCLPSSASKPSHEQRTCTTARYSGQG